ncbi:ABC transporter substrate-binding protein [Leucobacter sp. 1207-22]|uniref:ABC transporter substrate-binding protein n=1 Tax=Leucobacter sp. 1207-22 TaxID=2604456 RepID=UPI00406417CF
MKKTTFAAAGIVAALALSGCSATSGEGAAQQLNVYAWADEIPQSVFDAFTEETGIKVNVDNFDSNETMISKLATGSSGYDIVEPSQYAVQQLVGQGLVEPLDKSKIEGLDNIAEKFSDPIYDPGLEYSVPWVWGTTGLLYNSECTGGEEITSWKSLFDKKWEGKVNMLDNMLAAYIAGLQVNGYPANSKDEKEIAAATQSLIDQKAMLSGYNSTNYGDLVASGDVCMSMAWGGTQTAKIVDANEQVEYVLPEEGGSLWVDGISIAKGAPNQEAAYEFINFLLRPEIGAMATNDAGLASANVAAAEHVSDQGLLTNAAVYASDEQVANADFIVDPGAAMKFYQDGWTRVKAS